MTQDEIIEMAIQGHASTRDAIRWAMNQEREACAKLCDDHWEKDGAAYYCALTIRYRGQA
jgi:pyocin large subunit-like protein